MKSILQSSTASIAMLCLLQASVANPANAQAVTAQPYPGADVAPYFIDPATDPNPTNSNNSDLIQLLRDKVKYIFVIFNENHSFDNEYGTFPGVNGIYSDGQHPRSAANRPGFTQTYVDLNGNTVTVQPFLIGPQRVDHSHAGLARKLDVVNGVPQMDHFSYDEYYSHAKAGNNASQAQGTQFARLVMSHIDCNTIPLFWQYASRFTIFDNIFATEDTPSTPNAIAMIAGQSGETQWVKHGANGFSGPISGTINGNPASNYPNPSTTQGPPIVGDAQPVGFLFRHHRLLVVLDAGRRAPTTGGCAGANKQMGLKSGRGDAARGRPVTPTVLMSLHWPPPRLPSVCHGHGQDCATDGPAEVSYRPPQEGILATTAVASHGAGGKGYWGDPGIQREYGKVLDRLAGEAPPLSRKPRMRRPRHRAPRRHPRRRRSLDPLSRFRCADQWTDCGRRVSFHQLQPCPAHRPPAPPRVVGDPAVQRARPQPGNCRLGSVQRCFRRLPGPYGLRRDRSGPGSSPWSTPPRSLSRTSPSNPRTHRLPRGRAVASANRRSGRRACRST
jgi:Phosphoesterase family